MLSEGLLFNLRSIRSYTMYECLVDENSLEKEVSFHVNLGPSTERRGDSFPVYEVPSDKMVWLSDWSFNGGWLPTQQLSLGGSLGRITTSGQYVYVLNCAVYSAEMQIYSPARPIRYLPGEWIAVCFHHMGLPLDIQMRATFRFTEVPAPERRIETRVFEWAAKSSEERFDPKSLTSPGGR